MDIVEIDSAGHLLNFSCKRSFKKIHLWRSSVLCGKTHRNYNFAIFSDFCISNVSKAEFILPYCRLFFFFLLVRLYACLFALLLIYISFCIFSVRLLPCLKMTSVLWTLYSCFFYLFLRAKA